MLAFFIPSSILSMVVGRLRPRILQSFEKTGTRDYAQVLANGGVGGCLVILSLIVPDSRLYLLYLGSLAAVVADTWGTEVGVLVQGKTWLVTTMKEVSPGRSGGVSAAGLLGGVAGAIIIGLCGAPWAEGSSGRLLLWLAVAGLFGSVVDSLLGATIQARYSCDICGTVTERREHCGAAARLAGGLSWFTNDVVNLIASIAGAAGVWGR